MNKKKKEKYIKIPKDFFKKLKYKINAKSFLDFINEEIEEEKFVTIFFIKYPHLKHLEEELRIYYRYKKNSPR